MSDPLDDSVKQLNKEIIDVKKQLKKAEELLTGFTNPDDIPEDVLTNEENQKQTPSTETEPEK